MFGTGGKDGVFENAVEQPNISGFYIVCVIHFSLLAFRCRDYLSFFGAE